MKTKERYDLTAKGDHFSHTDDFSNLVGADADGFNDRQQGDDENFLGESHQQAIENGKGQWQANRDVEPFPSTDLTLTLP